MLIALLVIGGLILLCSAWLVLFSIYAYIALYRLADKHEIMLPFMEKQKQKREEEIKNEEDNERYNAFLEHLSKRKIICSEKQGAEQSYNELDAFTPIDQTENEPESLMKLLEFGLPDEEFSELMQMASSDKE